MQGTCAVSNSRWLILMSVLLAWTIKTSYGVDCNNGRITFERTPGVQLPSNDHQLSGRLQLLKNTAPTACYRTCLDSTQCVGYFIDHKGQNCILLDGEMELSTDRLVASPAWSYHRKICLGGKKCHRQWAFDRISGVQLFGYDDKTIREVNTRGLCLEACSVEDSFVCRSARYDNVNKSCVLSRHDRRTAPEAFRKSNRQVEYLENQCVTEPARCMFYQQTGRSPVHGHVHVERDATTREQCETMCLNHTDFTCRSFVFDPDRSFCLLTPDDSYSVLEGAVHNAEIQSFYERGSCIEVQMVCEATSMTAVVRVTTPFRGRVYAVGHPYECYAVTVAENGEVALTMPLHGRKCGTKNLGNGTFVNSVVVQHHPFVLRNIDRRIDVACDYEEVQRKLRGGKQVLEGYVVLRNAGV